ncbi:hypothetical protein B0H39_003255 [Clostridium beijerinckii]|uniref:hypothetical protein n=1 Tax=Clostridium beijerinckii TaxID=1520 RepID=UPI0030FE9B99|nr:hypothetical protein [Clostridium beijerinckii]
MCSIIFAVSSIFLRVIVLNKNTYTNILDKNNTYEQITTSVYDKIDAILSAKNINYDIKESIITEDDIRKEADTMISGLIDYLETGENNIKPLNTEIYKQRVADILQSIFGNLKSDKNDLSYNSNIKLDNMAYSGHPVMFSNMVVNKEQSQVEQNTINVEKLMSKDEAEARVREILKEKGLTEEQAIEKARKKGITEEQALNILAGYGITIDGDSTESTAEKTDSDTSSNNNSSAQENQANVKNSSEGSSNSKITNHTDQPGVSKSAKSQLENITKELQSEAEDNINKEVEKINLNKMLGSSKLQKIAKVTSISYKLFWLFIILPFILMGMLIKINGGDFNSSLKYIRNAFLSSGLVLLAISSGAYFFKAYEKINISQAYLVDTISYTIKYFSNILLVYGAIIFVIGLLMFLPKLRRRLN